jgi:hypothetical protein
VEPLPAGLWLVFSYNSLPTAPLTGLWCKITKGRRVPGQNTWFQLQHLADLVSSPFPTHPSLGFIEVKPKLLLTFQDRNFFHLQIRPAVCRGNSTLSVQRESTWSLRKITSYSRAITLPFTVPWSTYPSQPLRSPHIFPNAHGFAMLSELISANKPPLKEGILFQWGLFVLGLELKPHIY